MKLTIMLFVIINPFANADQAPRYELLYTSTQQECVDLINSVQDKLSESYQGMAIEGKCIPFEVK